jgi:hypothetical protein
MGKRRRNDHTYTQNMRKTKRNRSEEYSTQKSKIVAAKKIESRCLKKCATPKNAEKRKINFEIFLNMGDLKIYIYIYVERLDEKL